MFKLFTLDLIVQGPPTRQYMFKLVHYVACAVGKKAVGIWPKFLLVNEKEQFAFKRSRIIICLEEMSYEMLTWLEPGGRSSLNNSPWGQL